MEYAEPHRRTCQRDVVLEELRKTKSHPTAVELYEKVRRRLPKISLGTVYRNLELLARLGLIQKLEAGGRQARFDAETKCHFHVKCVNCGRVDDIDAPPLDLSALEGNDSTDYRIIGYTVQYQGVCPRCGRTKTNTKRRKKKC